MNGLPAPLARLIEELQRLPGVGRKTAARHAHSILRAPREHAEALAAAIIEVREKLRPCPACGNLTDLEACSICADPGRDQTVICVVEEAANVQVLERSREFRGLYHVLGGALSPLRGVSAEDLRIPELTRRIRESGEVTEVILATDSDVEGEATAHYLLRALGAAGVKVTRIATGLPVGTNLEYADELTLGKALAGRREM